MSMARKGENYMKPALHALLIGIDYYFSNNIDSARLEGCVHDIECVEDLLIYKMNIRQENIVKLTSSKANNSDKPSESSEKWPTYENRVAALIMRSKICLIIEALSGLRGYLLLKRSMKSKNLLDT